MIRVGLADDQLLVRAGFAMVLGSQDDIEVVWEAADGDEAFALAAAEPVDVVFMDVQMPRLNGIEATRRLVASGNPARVVILTTFDDDEYVLGAVTAGASGFLLKDADPEELLAAARTVGESEAVISPKATARLFRQVRRTGGAAAAGNAASLPPARLVDPLTERESEILLLVARGRSNTEIGEELVISLPTVKTHVGKILAKTGSRDRVHAVLFAFRHGLVAPHELLE